MRFFFSIHLFVPTESSLLFVINHRHLQTSIKLPCQQKRASKATLSTRASVGRLGPPSTSPLSAPRSDTATCEFIDFFLKSSNTITYSTPLGNGARSCSYLGGVSQGENLDVSLALFVEPRCVDLTNLIPSQPRLRVRRRRILHPLPVCSVLHRHPHPHVSISLVRVHEV